MRKIKEGGVPCSHARPWKFAVNCIYAGKKSPASTEYRHKRKQGSTLNLTFVQNCVSEFLLWIQLSSNLSKVGEQLPDSQNRADCIQETACVGVGARPCARVIWKTLGYHWGWKTKEEVEHRAFIFRSVVLKMSIYVNGWVGYPREYCSGPLCGMPDVSWYPGHWISLGRVRESSFRWELLLVPSVRNALSVTSF